MSGKNDLNKIPHSILHIYKDNGNNMWSATTIVCVIHLHVFYRVTATTSDYQ